MPTDKSVKDAPEPTPHEEPPATDTIPLAAVAEPPGLEPGVYEYTHWADCVYPHVPLTARTATPDTPATVFSWAFGAPDDGRWAKTRKKPNQAADNAPAPSSEE